MNDKEYMSEWKAICEAYCKRIGAELLFVNEDSFGCEMPNCEMRHIHYDELADILGIDANK